MKQKLYTCKYPNCSIQQAILNKGFCNYHREKQRQDEGEETMLSKKYEPKQTSYKRKDELKNKKEILNPFFNYHIEEIKKNPYCQNCGSKILPIKSCVAHVLPKRKTMNPEVMNHLDNAIYLCSQYSEHNCHKRFDDLESSKEVWDFEVWEIAVKKYLKLKPFIKNFNSVVENFEKYLENSKS